MGNFADQIWGISLIGVTAPGTVQDQGLVHRHRRRRVGPAARHGASQNRESAHPVAAETAPQLAGADPLGGAGPLGPLPGRVQRRAARREAGRGPLPRRAVGQRRPPRGPPPGPESDPGTSRPQTRPAVPGPQTARVSVGEHHRQRTHQTAGPARRRRPLRRGPRRLARQRDPQKRIYDIADANLGAATVNQLAQDLQDPAMPPEINRLGRTIWNWRHQISNWHAARVTTHPPKEPTTSSNASNAPPSGSPTSPTTESGPCSTPANPTGHCSKPSLRPETRRAGIESPTHPPKEPTTSSNASNAPPSGSPTSPTTESGPCSTPANPTGHCSKPSLRPETRRAGIVLRRTVYSHTGGVHHRLDPEGARRFEHVDRSNQVHLGANVGIGPAEGHL